MSLNDTLLNAKIQHHNLNMLYPVGFGTDAEANCRIEQKISEFANTYGKLAETHTFILEYHDDIISAICYRMLKVFSAITPINLVIYGKRRKTKDIVKEAKRIGRFKFNKLKKKGDIVYISPFNPLYQVALADDTFKELDSTISVWYPMKDFTPAQLQSIRLFYHIGYIKNDIIEDNEATNRLQRWCECSSMYENKSWEDDNFCFDNNSPEGLTVVYLTSSLEKNNILLREVENTDDIVLYKLPEGIDDEAHDQIITQLKQYSLFVKRHSNALGYLNVLNKMDITIADYEKACHCEAKYINKGEI